MAIGELVHSEVELDLRRKGYVDWELDRTMDMILLADRLYVEFVEKKSDKARKGQVGDGTEAAQNMVAEREKALGAKPKRAERKSKAV